MTVLPAVPKLSDEQVRDAVASSVSRGYFNFVDSQRVQITLDGFRRAEAARYRKGHTSRLPFEWSKLSGFTLGGAVLLHANRTRQGKIVYLEDLYVDFALTPLDALKGAIQDLREAGYLRAPTEEHAKMLSKIPSPSTGARDMAWVFGVTADGVRRAAQLESNANTMPNAANEIARKFIRSISSEQSAAESAVETMLRAIPRGLRELDATNRRSDRNPFVVTDEYDLQDFVRAVLRVRFPALAAEDAMHSVAGRGGRVDFRLKDEGIYVELKVFRDMNNWKQSMLPDISAKIQRYGRQEDCDVLFIFVYDPLLKFTEAESAERDLTAVQAFGDKKVDVRLIVAPKQ